ncbi:MAG: RIP metalloprotease RseP [Acidobacteriota bacterium]
MERLFDGLFAFLAFVVIVGLVVVIHEAGHHLAAKWVGVRVDVFSVGFGKRLFGWKRGETDYRVSLIPLGGFVKMHGDGISEEPIGAPDELVSRKPWEKMLIFAAGPAMNLVLTPLLLAATYMIGFETSAHVFEAPVVGVVEVGSPAEDGGVRAGDAILAVDGETVEDWRQLGAAVALRPGATVPVRVERDGSEVDIPVTLGVLDPHRIGTLGAHPCLRVVVGSVQSGGAAAAAGLEVGDELLAIDGEPTCASQALVKNLQAGEGSTRTFTVLRDDEELSIALTPRWHEPPGRWMIGIGPRDRAVRTVVERHGPVEALQAGVSDSIDYGGLILTTLGRLVTGHLSMRVLESPIGIAEGASTVARQGLIPSLQFMAFISLNLGLLNLLPIPILDGGRMALVGLEAVRGRDLAQRTKEWILLAGFVMIVVLMVVVLFLDVIKRLES